MTASESLSISAGEAGWGETGCGDVCAEDDELASEPLRAFSCFTASATQNVPCERKKQTSNRETTVTAN